MNKLSKYRIKPSIVELIESLRYRCNQMNSKCYDKTNNWYKWYGARGITVCNTWKRKGGKEYSDTFVVWALQNGATMNNELCRIDKTKGFNESNCFFGTRVDNMESRGTKPFGNKKLPQCVYKDSANENYKVLFDRNHKRYWIGCFPTIKRAVIARDKALQAYKAGKKLK